MSGSYREGDCLHITEVSNSQSKGCLMEVAGGGRCLSCRALEGNSGKDGIVRRDGVLYKDGALR